MNITSLAFPYLSLFKPYYIIRTNKLASFCPYFFACFPKYLSLSLFKDKYLLTRTHIGDKQGQISTQSKGHIESHLK
jgi:hypothetical protein